MSGPRPSQCAVVLTDAEIEHLEGRLRNWAEWLRCSGGGSGRCGSAEGLYVAPRPDGEALVAAMQSRRIDVVDAELVERALAELPDPSHRSYLRLVFLLQHSSAYVAKRAGESIERIDALHRRALAALAGKLAEFNRRPQLIRRGALHWAGLARR